MFKSKYVLILAILSVIGISSCEEDEKKKFTHVIQGRLIDATNNDSFQNLKIEAYNTYTARGVEYLGSCYTNGNGEFNLQYELSSNLTGNYLKLYFDTAFTAYSKLESLPIGESWNRNLYVGDSATVDIYLSRDLVPTDTLYLQTTYSKILFIGPTQNKHIGKVRVLNVGIGKYYAYAIGYNNSLKNKKPIYYVPTGDPIIDLLTLDINN